MANIDVSQASQGLAGGRSQRGQGLLGANEGWKQTQEDAASSAACRGWLLFRESSRNILDLILRNTLVLNLRFAKSIIN